LKKAAGECRKCYFNPIQGMGFPGS